MRGKSSTAVFDGAGHKKHKDTARPKVLVTGADGFIGQHLVRKLVDDGHPVVGLIHANNPIYFFSQDEIDCRSVDIRNNAALSGTMDGVETVYHLAAIPRNDWSKSWDDYRATNIDGTVHVLEEAGRSGSVKRFVFISTVEAAGFGDGIRPRSENDPSHPENNYGKSKLEAEKIVLDKSWPMECVVIRLPMIYGPGTFLIVPKLFGMVSRGIYPLIGDGGAKMEFCYIANAIDGIILAGEKKEAAGELFYLSDPRSYTVKEVVTGVAAAKNITLRFMHIPVRAAYIIGLLFEALANIAPFPPVVSKYSRKPFFSRETVRWTTQNINTVSQEKARRLLGYQPRVMLDEGCRRTADWLAEHGI